VNALAMLGKKQFKEAHKTHQLHYDMYEDEEAAVQLRCTDNNPSAGLARGKRAPKALKLLQMIFVSNPSILPYRHS